MTDFLIILGLVTLVAWGYIAIAVLAYALLFRKAWSGDRLFMSAMWPYTLPVALVEWVRLRRRRVQRVELPTARAQRKARRP